MARQRYTPEEAKEYTAHMIAQAETAIAETLQSDHWSDYVALAARFHHYSPRNTWLILAQCPHASQVASFKRWQESGRTVRKGEKAIKVYAPMSVIDRTTVRETDDETAEAHRKMIFKLVPVFDVSQTEGDPLPERPGLGPLAVENRAAVITAFRDCYQRLTAAGIALAMPERPAGETARGHWSAQDRTITVYANPDPASAYRILLHETAHYLAGHAGGAEGLTKEEKEITVELAAFIAASAQGFDIAPATAPYLAHWTDQTPERIRQYASQAHKTAQALIKFLGVDKQPAAVAA